MCLRYKCGYWLHDFDIVYFDDSSTLQYIIILFYILFTVYSLIFINNLMRKICIIENSNISTNKGTFFFLFFSR